VRICGGVQEAVDEIDILRPDIIILELQLTSHNGYEFLYELRSYSEWDSIPVLIHSMVPEDSLDLNPITKSELGITGYLYKPGTSLGKLHYELNKRFLVNKV
jgi:DNA-binding response OmpR family regulator